MRTLSHKWIFFWLLLLLSLQADTTAAEILHFTILHTSDEHSSLMPVPLISTDQVNLTLPPAVLPGWPLL